MVIGIAGGLVMGGLILGALSGSAWLLIGFSLVGLLFAEAAEAMKEQRTRKAASYKLAQYPPYRY